MIPSGGAPGLRADAELPRVPGAARSAWDSASRQASALGEATQADHFPERNIEVHDPDAADGAAHVKVVTIPTQTGGEGGKLFPVVSPGKGKQEEANLQANHEIGRAHV